MKDVDIEAALAANRRKILSVRRAEGHDQPELSAERLRKMATRSKRARGRRQRSDAEAVRWARKLQRLMQGLIGLQVASLLLATAAAGAPVLLLFCGIDGFGMAATLPDVQRHHALCTVFNLCYLLGSVGAPVALSAARSDEDDELPPLLGPFLFVLSSLVNLSSLAAGAAAAYVLRRPLMLYRYGSVALDEEAADLRLVRGLSAFTVDDAESALGSPGGHGCDEVELAEASEGEPVVPLVFLPVKATPKTPKTPKPKRDALSKAIATVPMLTPPPRGQPAGGQPAGGVARKQSWLEAAEAASEVAFGPPSEEEEGGEEEGAEPAPVKAAPAAALRPVAAQRLVLSDESDEESDEGGGEGGGEAGGAADDPEGGGAAAGRLSLGAKVRGLGAGLRGKAVEGLRAMAEAVDEPAESADELFARAKALNAEGRYKKACEALEAAYALQPKISTALSAANLRVKLGDHAMAAAAYRQVIAAAQQSEGGPSAAELSMARSRLKEAEEGLRASRVGIELLPRGGVPASLAATATSLEEKLEDLFSESASLYAEHGTELQDGIRQLVRLLRARRLVAAGQTLKPIERLVTRACLAERDEQEREWLTAVRTMLNELRSRAAEVSTALREFKESGDGGGGGWKLASEAAGVRTEWRPADEGAAFWIRLGGELRGASLTHALSVAYEADLWRNWIPLCSAAEVVAAPEPLERVTYCQFDLPMLRRGLLLHWSLSDQLLERQSLLLLGASVPEGADARLPAAAAGVALAEAAAIKVLVQPLSRSSARIDWVMQVDLKASSALPQAIVSMVTNKIGGSVLALLLREAQKVAKEAAREAATAAGDERGPPSKAALEASVYLRRLEAKPEVYAGMEQLTETYFECIGHDSAED